MPRIALIVSCLLLFVSCSENLVFSKFQSTSNGSWGRGEVVDFAFSELDSLQSYNLFITLRNDGTYPYSNLFLIAELTRPDGTSQRDTLEYQMADAEGNWLGTGYGSVMENKLWYIEDVDFPDSGVYTVSVSHAMRKNGSVEGIEELPGVLDVGLQIEKNRVD